MNIPLTPEQNAAFLLFLFFVPPLVALIKQAKFPQQVNALIAQAVYIVVGVGAAIWSGIPVNFQNAMPLIAIATVVGTAAYKLIWSQIGVDKPGDPSVDDRITEATSEASSGTPPTPKLAETLTGSSISCRARRTRSAMAAAAPVSAPPSTMANSSPPYRAAIAPDGAWAESSWPSTLSTSSPTG